jgi:tetratricopeptide (TPR) repeat protein
MSLIAVALAGFALATQAAVLEPVLNPDRPADRAIQAYRDLERSGKASASDLADLGVLLLDRGMVADGERYLRAAFKLDPHNAEVAYRLGLVLQRQGKPHEAARWFRRTLKASPDQPYAHFMLARTAELCGWRSLSIKHYLSAYHVMPQLADPMRNPLVLDSRLQTEVQLRRYRQTVESDGFRVRPIDPTAVRRMMEAQPLTPVVPPPAQPQQSVRQAQPAPVRDARPPAGAGPGLAVPPGPVPTQPPG